jgi:hypothetical protein
MPKETFIAYWGNEPTGSDQSPTLAEIPDNVDIVILYYAEIDKKGDLNFSMLLQYNDQATIMRWMAEIRARQQHQPRRTKFFLCILNDSLHEQDPTSFADKVESAARSWGVDGIDIDYESPSPSVLPVVKAINKKLKDALPTGFLMSAPIYDPWILWEELNPIRNGKREPVLASYAGLFDYIMTMDYTPYPGYKKTIEKYEKYAEAMGLDAAYGKLAIGVSCMDLRTYSKKFNPWNNYTPLEDVKKFCKYKPTNKLGVMLFTLSYDAPGHAKYPYPLFTYTNAIVENLP